jgi:hypothetical protein
LVISVIVIIDMANAEKIGIVKARFPLEIAPRIGLVRMAGEPNYLSEFLKVD